MSWDVVISRLDDANPQDWGFISFEEWQAVVGPDPSLLLVSDKLRERLTLDGARVLERRLSYRWLDGDSTLGPSPRLCWEGGQISVHKPNTALLRKAQSLARGLGANVRDISSTQIIPEGYDPDAETAAYHARRAEKLRLGPSVGPRGAPAVPIDQSIMPDHLVCLEDGKKVLSLRRYLENTYSMTPEAYRKRWGLADDYPMVAPNALIRRSSLAREVGRSSLNTVADDIMPD